MLFSSTQHAVQCSAVQYIAFCDVLHQNIGQAVLYQNTGQCSVEREVLASRPADLLPSGGRLFLPSHSSHFIIIIIVIVIVVIIILFSKNGTSHMS